MPYSFTQIEKDKSKVIGFVFAFLISLYFLTAWVIYFAVKFYVLLDSLQEEWAYSSTVNPLADLISIEETLLIFLIATFCGFIHWFVIITNLVPKILRSVGAQELDPKDSYHQMFQNIIEEVSIATGGKKIRGVVAPTMAMNAFAVADFEGRATIGITEGLLSRLSRAQIEAVVGHEAAHIVSGDCLSTTVISSLFGLYTDMLSGMQRMMFSGGSRGRGRGQGVVLIVFVILQLANLMASIMRMFIFRQREFRADAIAVRLTRDPLALAGALYTISRRWRGSGVGGEYLEAIFMMNPKFSRLDENTGFFSDLFSTHPPVKKRLDVLLNMAHAETSALEEEFSKQKLKPRQIPSEMSVAQTPLAGRASEWIIYKDGQWLGPYGLEQLTGLGWLQPDSWIKQVGGERVTHAFEDQQLSKVFKQGSSVDQVSCPKCQTALSQFPYEGLSILKCPYCLGILVKSDDIFKILSREEIGLSENIQKIANGLEKELATRRSRWNDKVQKINTVQLLTCPVCRNAAVKMVRMFYSDAYRIEIDKCVFCDNNWFDKDEIEVLQYLVEKMTQTNPGG